MKSFLRGLDSDKDERKHWLSGERFSRLGRSSGSVLVGKSCPTLYTIGNVYRED